MNWKNGIHEYIYINENSKNIKAGLKVVEGGSARNYALMSWIECNVKNLNNIEISNNSIKNILTIFSLLVFKRNYNIIFQYVTVGFAIHSDKFLGKIVSNIYIKLVKWSSKYNNIIFDISDIKYEQSIDLNLLDSNLNQMKKIEDKFFKLPVEFIFASNSMCDYVCDKYRINKDDADVCINGGNMINYNKKSNLGNHINKYRINYVYAGSLNKGRQIEEMISNFPKNNKVQLILMGAAGEWIKDNNSQENIIYLGAVEETEAHYLVSKCDIGLIPYDDSKFYYNIAYPTKLSFYITAEIPFLSTGVIEVKKINDIYEIGYIDKINNWSNIINNITLEEIEDKKIKIKEIKENFYWDNIFRKNKFIK